jgi:hypothetical protein
MDVFSYPLIPVLLDFTDWIFPIWIHFRKSSPWGLDFLLLLGFLLLLLLLYLAWTNERIMLLGVGN